MRKLLDLVCLVTGALGGLFMVLIAAVILYQVVGRNFGYGIPGVDDLAALFLVASAFLSLAYTYREGGHIRVNLLLSKLPEGLRRAAELWCVVVSAALTGFLTWWMFDTAIESFIYGDRAIGQLPILLWIPQGAAAFGLLLFTISLIDDLVAVLQRRVPSYDSAKARDLQAEG